jgi:DNA-binding NtrC family response regulator
MLSGMSAPRVLLVDDDPLVLSALEELVAAIGFDPVAVDSADAGLRHVRLGGLDVVVSDLAMPGRSGLDLLREVRVFDAALPVILISGRATDASIEAAVVLGVFRFLRKPGGVAALPATIAAALDHRRGL